MLLLLPSLAVGQGTAVPALGGVPVQLAMDRDIWVQPPGGQVSLEVSLRDPSGAPVVAFEDVRVELRSSAFERPRDLVLRAGASSARFSFVAPAAGEVRLEAVASGLAPASCLLVVDERAAGSVSPPPPAPGPEPPSAGGTAGSLAGVTGAGRAPARARLLVNPERALPDAGGVWRAALKVALVGEDGRLVTVGDAFQVQLAAGRGRLSADVVDIPAGKALSPAVELTSTADGTDRVVAFTPFGQAEAQVSFDRAPPARLRLHAPSRVRRAEGGARAQLVVLLVSGEGTPAAYTDRDVSVTLETTLGSLEPAALTIPRGAVAGAVTLSSAHDGRARVTAAAAGLPEEEVHVRFSFPFLLALLAGAGGAVGQLAARPRSISTRSALRSGAVGVVIGLLFYGVASFGAFKEGLQLPFPVEVTRIATGSELGALVLGLLGGLLGAAFWRPGRGKSGGRAGGTAGKAAGALILASLGFAAAGCAPRVHAFTLEPPVLCAGDPPAVGRWSGRGDLALEVQLDPREVAEAGAGAGPRAAGAEPGAPDLPAGDGAVADGGPAGTRTVALRLTASRPGQPPRSAQTRYLQQFPERFEDEVVFVARPEAGGVVASGEKNLARWSDRFEIETVAAGDGRRLQVTHGGRAAVVGEVPSTALSGTPLSGAWELRWRDDGAPPPEVLRVRVVARCRRDGP